MEAPTHPLAKAPERTRTVVSGGIGLRVYEWGDPAARPLLLVHGMFDHARGFDTLAPFFADDYRVVAFDARGHGDSDRVDVYGWPSDVRDLAAVLADLGAPADVVGHSRGGGVSTDAAAAWPHLVRRLVNIDGFGPPPEGFEEPGGKDREPDGSVGDLSAFLDARRGLATRSGWRPYADLDALVARRGQQNPRLDREWLRYFVYHGAKQVEGGWVWKVDPLTGMGAGPWDPDWTAPGWRGVKAPMLALTGTVPDVWGPLRRDVLVERVRFVEQCQCATIEGTGHFVHMEKPAETARVIRDFLES